MQHFLLPAAGWLTILIPPLMLAGRAPLEIATALVAILFLAHSALARDWSWLRVRWVQVLVALWGWTIISSLLNGALEDSVMRSVLWLRYVVLAPALAYWILPDTKTQKRLFIALAATVLFLCADAVLQYITGTDIFGQPYRETDGKIRLTGPFSRPMVGILLVWVAFPVVCAWLGSPHSRTRFAALALSASVVVVAFLSGERMAFLLSGLGFCLTFLLVKRARLPLFLVGIAALIALVGLMELRPALKARQLGESSSEIVGFWESAYGRLWLSSLAIVAHNPVAGVGPKNFREACPDPRYGTTDPDILPLRCTLHSHNIYMEWLSETGLVGYALFMWLMAEWLMMIWHQRRLMLTDALLAGLVVALALRLWPLSATTSQFAGWSAGPFWLLVGWLMARLHTASRTHT